MDLVEISRCELLSREEENRLAKRVMEKNDKIASRRLVTANLRLVVKIAMDFQRYWTKNLLDLIREGNLGLLRAIEKLDPYYGEKS